MRRLRTGVIGCGAIAQMMHLPYLRELDDRFEISALCDWDATTLAEVGRQYGVNRLFSSSAELLKEPLDAVLILSSGNHAPDTLAAIERGLHVLVEKPLAYTLRETDEIIAAKRHDRTLMVGMMKQYDPGYQRGAELVREMRDLRYVSATTLEAAGTDYQGHHAIVRGQNSRPPGEKTYGAEMFHAAQQGILASQPIELLKEATGSDDPTVLVAYFLLIVSSIHDINVLRGALGQPGGVLTASAWAGGTSFTATLAYPDDVRANYTWTLLPHIRSYSQNFHFYGSDEYVKITFPSPYLKSTPTLVDVSRMSGDVLEETRLTVSYEEAFKRELIEFSECVATGREPRTTAEGFRQDLEVLTAIARTLAAQAG
jgi:predicted dehydrogenase